MAIAGNDVSKSINLLNDVPLIALETGAPRLISNELCLVVMFRPITLRVPFDRHSERLTAMISDEITSSRKSRWRSSSTKERNQKWDAGPHLDPVS